MDKEQADIQQTSQIPTKNPAGTLQEKTKHETSHKPLKFDRIEDVYNALGGYSWFQLWATLVLLLPEIPGAMLSFLPVFTTTNNVEFICEQENGEMKSVILGLDMNYFCSNCTSLYAPPTTTDKRNLYYANYGSVVQEWNFVCDRSWLTDIFTSIQMAGMMTGSLVGSILADRFGRKKCYYLACLFMTTCGIGSGLALDIYTYAIARFLIGLAVGGYYVVFYIYLIEFLTPNWRIIAGCVSIWCLGEMLLAFLAYNIYSWRILTIASSLLPFVLLTTYPLMPESPRWSLCNGRTKEATASFNQIARWNSKPLIDSKIVAQLQANIFGETSQDQAETSATTNTCEESKESFGPLKQSPNPPSSEFTQILTNPRLCLQLCIFIFGWFSCALVYYGSTFNTKSLRSGDPYLNVLWLGLIDLPAFPSGAIFSNWIGRKKTYSCLLLFGGIFLIGIVCIEFTLGINSMPNLVMIFNFIARFGICGAWGIVSCFTAESFPTTVRTTCVGLCQIFANVGGIIAPQLAYLATVSEALPYFIFCGLIVCSALFSWFLKETHGKPLAENIVSG